MATYEEYLEHAKSKKFQPVKEDTFNSLSKAGFDPIKSTFENEARKAANIQKSSFPLTTAAFEEVARSDKERFDRKAEKTSGGGGGAMPKSNRDLTKNYKAGGKVNASSRADGIAQRGRTKGRMV